MAPDLRHLAQPRVDPGDAPRPIRHEPGLEGIAARGEAPGPVALRHLGRSGLAVTLGGRTVTVDPFHPVDGPVVVTWSEAERVAGARHSTGPLAARARLLSWLGREGVGLESRSAQLDGFTVRAREYEPIPYATAPEAVRKALSALRSPCRAAGRLAFTAGRPPVGPIAVALERAGQRVVLLGQALHRFVTPAALDALIDWAGPAALVVAGTDYDDEDATGRALARFPAERRVIADLVGEVRRELGLPTRPLAVALAAAPPGTVGLEAGGGVRG